ncbi:MAG: hypothetical protein ABS939_02560 [Psychrobacillus sp.]
MTNKKTIDEWRKVIEGDEKEVIQENAMEKIEALKKNEELANFVEELEGQNKF